MPQTEIYTSPDGDSWFLCRNELGHVYVVHEPKDGQKGSAVGLGDFLTQSGVGPQHEALLQLIGTLTEQPNPL